MALYKSNGKLLLTGEYVVLDGAKALALPSKFGQNMQVSRINEPQLIWESYAPDTSCWLQVVFDLPKLKIKTATYETTMDGGEDSLAENLQKILLEVRNLKPHFLLGQEGYFIKTKLEFPRNWGLGSSSTLINNLAQWAAIDAFELQFNTFKGSAYDIACAQNDSPILYQLIDNKPSVQVVDFQPNFKDQLYFVHLNRKQNSRRGIEQYKNNKGAIDNIKKEISNLSLEILKSSKLVNFENLIKEHEQLISSVVKLNPIQNELFSDYFGQTKSLGAWGGDFILATGNESSPGYFKKKGFETIISYQDMVL